MTPTMTTLELLNTSVLMPDLTIGQAIDIATIQQKYNERRLSALIGHITDNPSLAGSLTVQERYYFLLNHRDLSNHNYTGDAGGVDSTRFVVETLISEIPDSYVVGEITVQHLRGAHACVIEGLCENVFDWLCGQMACQLYGNLASTIGGDIEGFDWDQLPLDATENAIGKIVKERFELIGALNINQFNDLVHAFNLGNIQLAHLVELSCDMDGLTLLEQGGDQAGQPSRFHTLGHIQGTAARIIDRIAERRTNDDGTRQNELA